ncbi:MAG TPA: NADH ubiquinone oxidoreductase, partial [Gammaproteobacteria bacterium]|nr:NADH ubiquinone oxidoreductase [Gammaproteobacteria bacterium]
MMHCASGFADDLLIDDFSDDASSRWEFIADGVMGGVSYGSVQFNHVEKNDVMILSGTVSTENNGGFIQARRALSVDKTRDYQGIMLTVKGNGEEYFLHLRSFWTLLPWQYYQAGFKTDSNWKEVAIPFSAFKPSSRVLPKNIAPKDVESLGVVAFGRDHEASITI